MWIALSIFGAFFQAVGAALKKKSLQTQGMNNTIGFVSFLVAGLIFGILYFAKTGTVWQADMSANFWQGILWTVGLNLIAIWFMYRALDSAEFNYLMPFMTLTSLSIIFPPIFLLGEIPRITSLLGIMLIVAGVLYMNYRPKDSTSKETKSGNRKGALYFTVTALCFTFTPTFSKIAIQESSVLYASFLIHLMIGLGFLAMVILFRESKMIVRLTTEKTMRRLLAIIALAGVIIVLENGSVNAALSQAPVAYVMALKRLMPLFAFLIGVFYFKERTDLKKKMIATALMVAGAVIITVL